MNKDDMIREIAGLSGKTPYFGSYTYELDGRTFELELPGIGKKTLEAGRTKLVFDGKESDYQAVKCEDETFLDVAVLGMNGFRPTAVFDPDSITTSPLLY